MTSQISYTYYLTVPGPPSGPATALTNGACEWAKDLPGLGEALIHAVTSQELAEFAKNIGVAVVATVAGAALCSTGVGCVVIAAAIGAGVNIAAEEGLDCAYRECGQLSPTEILGDGLQGAVIGASSRYLNTRLAGALGASKPAVGVLVASWQYGVNETGVAVASQAGERAALAFVKYLVEQTVGGS
jgi:hypothetical protein